MRKRLKTHSSACTVTEPWIIPSAHYTLFILLPVKKDTHSLFRCFIHLYVFSEQYEPRLNTYFASFCQLSWFNSRVVAECILVMGRQPDTNQKSSSKQKEQLGINVEFSKTCSFGASFGRLFSFKWRHDDGQNEQSVRVPYSVFFRLLWYSFSTVLRILSDRTWF